VIVDERRARALARWACSTMLIQAEECEPGDRVVDEVGLAWVAKGEQKFQLLKAGMPMVGVFAYFDRRRWVILVQLAEWA